MQLPTSLFRAEQVRELDRIAISELGRDGYSLMEQAGRSAWEVLQSSWPRSGRVCVVCGGGNNGGDGYVLARLALEHGVQAETLYTSDPEMLAGAARTAFHAYNSNPGARSEKFTPQKLAAADVIVDAILGTGIDRPVTGELLQVIEEINQAGRPVLALDIPSGLNADTGNPMGTAVRAQVTVTFVGMKQGLLTGAGREYGGRIYFSDLDLPAQVYQRIKPNAIRMDYSTLSYLLQRRIRDSHKGAYGHVLVVGGDYGYSGAVRMAAEAAARTGAGLVSIGTRPTYAVGIPLAVPEIMARGIEKKTELNPLLERATVVAVGPGLGQSEWSSRLLAHVLDSKLPLVADADALNLLARDPVFSDKWVLTPHPGEAARLLQTTTRDITSDRIAAVRQLQEKFGGVIVLKGSGTLVADGASIHVCSDGNPGMASGGMGDVLTGIIAGLAAQEFPLPEAARLGVCLHAAAADAAAGQGERGLLATDLMPWLRKLVNPVNT